MRTYFRQAAGRINASYWFIPALLTIGAVLLSIATTTIDRQVGVDWLADNAWLEASRPDGARELLSTISGSMISVAGTVFAITIAAVVYASGNYGPRLLTNFMTDRGNQWSLGIFIATYVYCLMVLRTVRQPDEEGAFGTEISGFVPEISLIVAMALTLLSVGVLVFFLHHVPDSIRINNVVAAIGKRALEIADNRFPDGDAGVEPETPTGRGDHVLRAGRVGYIEVIDFDSLAKVREQTGDDIHLAVRPGDFVHPDVVLLHSRATIGDEGAARLREAFAMGHNRTAAQDLEYLIDELVEIGLRALSPGINDPFTAITCLHWIGAVMALIASRDLRRDSDGSLSGQRGVHALPDDFEHFVSRGFGSIRASAAGSVLAALNFVDALESVAAGRCATGRADLLRREARLLLAQSGTALSGPAYSDVRSRVERFCGIG